MGRYDRLIRRVFAASAIVWAATIVLGPPLARARTLASDVLVVPLYLAGSLICHQRPERSFQFAGEYMPVCARCTGIYVGAALVAMVIGWGRRLPATSVSYRWPAWTIAFASTVPSLATLVYEWTTGDMPSNGLRAAAGVPMGAVVSWLVLRPFDNAQGRPAWSKVE